MQGIGIVGLGRFGRALADLANAAGLAVRAIDAHAKVPQGWAARSLGELAEASEILVLAVPVAALDAVLDELAAHLAPGHLVMDVGSVKLRPTHSMAARIPAGVDWIGTHPLFGPLSIARGEARRVVVCPNPLRPEAAARARRFYERLGCEVIERDADAHDRAMASTQAMAFFVARGMLDAGLVDADSEAIAPPSFEAMAKMIDATRADSGHLYQAIARDNPHVGAARRRLIEALIALDRE